MIGITNDLTFRENLDADVRSSLGEDEIVFSPYNSNQLRNILARRAEGALKETGFSCQECQSPDCPHEVERSHKNLYSNILDDEVIPLAAAFAAQDTGDAREALKLLFRAVRFVDDRDGKTVSEEDIHNAREYLEEKAIVSGIQTLPKQKIISLMTVAFEHVQGNKEGKTSDLYSRYKKYCDEVGTDPVSNRRFRDFLDDLEHNGVMTKTSGLGRGKENAYSISVDLELVLENLPDPDERLGTIAETLRKRSG